MNISLNFQTTPVSENENTTSHEKQGKGWGVCMKKSEESFSPESMFCALLEAFNTPSSVLQAFPINWQTASDWEIVLISHMVHWACPMCQAGS